MTATYKSLTFKVKKLERSETMRIGLIEIALVELVLCLLLWVIDEYIASLLCVAIPAISLAILIIAIIAEWIEPSKVPRIFFGMLLITALVPLISFAVYFGIYGSLGWMES